MSRTYRKLAGRRTRSGKMFMHRFTYQETRMSRGQIRRDFIAAKCWTRYERWEIEHRHHEVFRNGSCYRQRANAVRITKQLDRQQVRATLKEHLRRIFVYGYDDIVRHGGSSRIRFLGGIKKTC